MTSHYTYWWITLGLGLIVIVAAVALLQTFLDQVHRLERAAGEVWAMGKRVAANTASTWMLETTSDTLDDLIEEAGRHESFLRSRSSSSGRV